MIRIGAVRRLGAAAVAGLALAAAPALAQEHHGPAGVHQMTEEQRAEHQRQIGALLGVVLAHTDFEAVNGRFAELIDANAATIGGDTEALKAHVSMVLDHLAEAGRTDPQDMGAHLAEALVAMHMHHAPAQ